MAHNPEWTAAETKKLRALVEQGKKPQQIANTMKRHLRTIAKKIRLHCSDLVVIKAPEPWTEAERQRGAALRRSGLTWPQVAKALGRACSSTQTNCLGLVPTCKDYKPRKEEDPITVRWEMPPGMADAYRQAVNRPWGSMGAYRP